MKSEKAGAAALHAHGGDTHVVGVFALRVLLVEDTSGWFAQGLDIDYAACGVSADEAKKNFEDGFCATVHEHLLMHGDIERLLKPAEQDAWKDFYAIPKAGQRFSCIQLHSTAQGGEGRLAENLPFDSIAFLQKVPSQAKGALAVPA